MKVKFNDQMIELQYLIQEKEEMRGFIVVDKDMKEIHSSSIQGLKIYLTLPSVDTPVCSRELAHFVEMVKGKDVTLIAISMDLPFALERWCQANVSDQLIAASDFRYHAFAGATHTLMKGIGLFARSVMLVDEYDQVQYLEVVEDVSHEPNYKALMQALEKSA